MAYWKQLIGKPQQRQHRAWLDRGRTGEGRIDLANEVLDDFKLSGKNWTAARFVRCRFADCRLDASDLIDAELEDCSAQHAEFISCHFDKARINRCSFAGIWFNLSDFVRARIGDCDLSGSLFSRVFFQFAKVERTRFVGADILNARLDDAEFTACDFSKADLSDPDPFLKLCTTRRTRFIDCDFRDSRWEGRLLSETVFERCRFHGVAGKPIVEGPITIIAPDFSPAGDGSDVRDPEALLCHWQ